MSDQIVYITSQVRVGDVIAYPGRVSRGTVRTERDWLLVTRIEGESILGTRVHPEGWEQGIEFTVYPRQVRDNGVAIRSGVSVAGEADQG